MVTEVTLEEKTGYALFTFKGRPRVGIHLQARAHEINRVCGTIRTGAAEDDIATYDVTTERSLRISYPFDPIVAESQVLPVGATGNVTIEFDAEHALEGFDQSWVKVVFSKVINGVVYHKFAWVEAPE